MQGDEKHAGYNLPSPAALNNAASPHIYKVSPNVRPQILSGLSPLHHKTLTAYNLYFHFE